MEPGPLPTSSFPLRMGNTQFGNTVLPGLAWSTSLRSNYHTYHVYEEIWMGKGMGLGGGGSVGESWEAGETGRLGRQNPIKHESAQRDP